MDDTLRQLGELALGAVPTVILFVVIWILYRLLVHGALSQALTERRSKTVGAVEKAKSDVSAAAQKTAEYEQRINEARLAVFKAQEARRQRLMEQKTMAIAEARAAAETLLTNARKEIQKESEIARAKVQAESSNLATEIVRAILRIANPARQPAGGRG